MKRSFLNELNLEQEVVDKIMTEYGKSVSRYKDEINEYHKEITELKASSVDSEDAIKKALQKQKEELKEQLNKASQYDEVFKELTELKGKEEKRVYNQAVDNFFKDNKIEFTSTYAKESILNKFNAQGFKLDDNGKFNDDVLKFMNDLKTAEKDAFKVVTADMSMDYNPSQGNNQNNSLETIIANAIMGK